ncbi:general secretion pathway protein GspK [Chlamydiota bacterium]
MKKNVPMKCSYLSNKNGGFILIPVIALLLVMVVVTFYFGGFINKKYVVAKKFQNDVKRKIKVHNVIEGLSAVLFSTGYKVKYNDARLQNIFFLGDVDYIAEDESGKINVNMLFNESNNENEEVVKQVKVLLRSQQLHEWLIDPILDWIDQDQTSRLHGAEDEYYTSLQYPYKARNGFLQDISELKLIRGLEKNNLNRFFTVFSNGKININTASKEVLFALSDMLNQELVEAIIMYREKTPFMTNSHLLRVKGMTKEVYRALIDKITVTSGVIKVSVTIPTVSPKKTVECFLQIRQDSVKILAWHEL